MHGKFSSLYRPKHFSPSWDPTAQLPVSHFSLTFKVSFRLCKYSFPRTTHFSSQKLNLKTEVFPIGLPFVCVLEPRLWFGSKKTKYTGTSKLLKYASSCAEKQKSASIQWLYYGVFCIRLTFSLKKQKVRIVRYKLRRAKYINTYMNKYRLLLLNNNKNKASKSLSQIFLWVSSFLSHNCRI